MCVSSCPTDYWVYLQTIAVETANGGAMSSTERDKMICKYSVDPMATVSSVHCTLPSKQVSDLIS